MKSLRVFPLSLILLCATKPVWGADMSDQAMNAWISSAKPVAQHSRLQQLTGRWKVHQRDWRGGATPWNDSDGLATWRPVLGGRFMQQVLETRLKNYPYHGVGLVGFDRDLGKYVGAWMDDFGTSLLPLRGDWDESTNTLTLKGYLGRPGAQWTMKQSWRDKDHMTVEWWGPKADGSSVKVVQVDYTRIAA